MMMLLVRFRQSKSVNDLKLFYLQQEQKLRGLFPVPRHAKIFEYGNSANALHCMDIFLVLASVSKSSRSVVGPNLYSLALLMRSATDDSATPCSTGSSDDETAATAFLDRFRVYTGFAMG